MTTWVVVYGECGKLLEISVSLYEAIPLRTESQHAYPSIFLLCSCLRLLLDARHPRYLLWDQMSFILDHDCTRSILFRKRAPDAE